jgi:hypothetical protein
MQVYRFSRDDLLDSRWIPSGIKEYLLGDGALPGFQRRSPYVLLAGSVALGCLAGLVLVVTGARNETNSQAAQIVTPANVVKTEARAPESSGQALQLVTTTNYTPETEVHIADASDQMASLPAAGFVTAIDQAEAAGAGPPPAEVTTKAAIPDATSLPSSTPSFERRPLELKGKTANRQQRQRQAAPASSRTPAREVANHQRTHKTLHPRAAEVAGRSESALNPFEEVARLPPDEGNDAR